VEKPIDPGELLEKARTLIAQAQSTS